jgi:hypothetical protein
MSNKTFALLVETNTKRFFSGSTFISDNNTIFQIVRDIEFSPEISPNNTYTIKLISYDNKKDFIMDRENFTIVASYDYDFTNDDVELVKHNNKIYKESIKYINNIKYSLGLYFSYYIDEVKQKKQKQSNTDNNLENDLINDKYIYFMSHPFLSINQ